MEDIVKNVLTRPAAMPKNHVCLSKKTRDDPPIPKMVNKPAPTKVKKIKKMGQSNLFSFMAVGIFPARRKGGENSNFQKR